MRQLIHRILRSTVKFVGSNTFFLLVCATFFIGSAWIAVSFKYPLLYDEVFHYPVIEIIAEEGVQLSGDQPLEYDQYGNLSNGDVTLFHYLMAIPLTAINWFTDNLAVEVVTLRLLNVLLVLVGLFVYWRLMIAAGIKKVYANISLLLFTLIPIVPFVAAHINYDNLIFPLFGLYALTLVSIIKNGLRPNYRLYTALISIGAVASLVKYTFLPVFALTLVPLLVLAMVKHRPTFIQDLFSSFKQTRKLVAIFMAIILVLSVSLFSLKYVQNIVVYGSPKPSCAATLSEERCLANPIYKRNQAVLSVKDQLETVSPEQYSLDWFMAMIQYSVSIDVKESGGFIPIFKTLAFYALILSVLVLVYTARRTFRDNKRLSALFYLSLLVIASVFVANYTFYLNYHVAYATQPRYLIVIMPLLVGLSVVAMSLILRSRWLGVALLSITMILMTQGGGALTAISRSTASDYWQNTQIIEFNRVLQSITSKFIKET